MKIAPSTPTFVHRRHHLVTRDVIGPVRHTVPRSPRIVRLIGMDLGIDNRHRGSSSVPGEFGHCSRLVSRGQRRRASPAPTVVSGSAPQGRSSPSDDSPSAAGAMDRNPCTYRSRGRPPMSPLAKSAIRLRADWFRSSFGNRHATHRLHVSNLHRSGPPAVLSSPPRPRGTRRGRSSDNSQQARRACSGRAQYRHRDEPYLDGPQ